MCARRARGCPATCKNSPPMYQPPTPSARAASTVPSTSGHAASGAPEASNRAKCPVGIASRSKKPPTYSTLPGPTASASTLSFTARADAGTGATCARAEPAATAHTAVATMATAASGQRVIRPHHPRKSLQVARGSPAARPSGVSVRRSPAWSHIRRACMAKPSQARARSTSGSAPDLPARCRRAGRARVLEDPHHEHGLELPSETIERLGERPRAAEGRLTVSGGGSPRRSSAGVVARGGTRERERRDRCGSSRCGGLVARPAPCAPTPTIRPGSAGR